MKYLKKEDIILINELTIKRHGGNFVPPFNLLKESNLDYLIEAVDGELFEQALYPTISEKAGLYLFKIISGHVFQDGNKRTGLESGLLFLKLNEYLLREELTKVKKVNNADMPVITSVDTIPKSGETVDEILYNFIIEVASGELNLEDCQNWFAGNIKKKK